MRLFVRKSTLFTVIVALSFILPVTGYSDLAVAIRKHQGAELDGVRLDKLAKYDHFIRYFSNFSYFEPRHKVSPNFIRALIIAESDVSPTAVSKKNAIGLAQIIPSTGKQAASELANRTDRFKYVSKEQLNNLGEDDLLDPAVNILIACYLISKYNYKFDGKLDLVVSAWNAGENTKSLKRWHHAPYKETEELIGKVNAYYLFLQKHKVFR